MQTLTLVETDGQAGVKLVQHGKPEPGPGQVLVRIHASSINRRDYWITRGLYPGIRYNCILGSDAAGTVEATGAGVPDCLAGREIVIYPVYGWGNDQRLPGNEFRILGMPDPGTFADYICVPYENAVQKPPHLTMQQAAALPLAGLTGWRALISKACLQRGETVLVTGIGGGVATMVLKFAVAAGARVIVTSSSDQKITSAIRFGAVAGYRYGDKDWIKRLQDEQGGLDIIIDGNCGPQFEPCFRALNPGGRYIIFGFTQGPPASPLDPARLFFRQLRIEGTTMGSPAEFIDMLKFVSDEKLEPVVDRVYPLGQGPQAFEYVGQGSQLGKVVLDHLA